MHFVPAVVATWSCTIKQYKDDFLSYASNFCNVPNLPFTGISIM